MDKNNIFTLIQQAQKNEKYYSELSKVIQVNIREIPYFLKQFLLFEYLGNYTKTEYINYFNCSNIINFELSKPKHRKKTFYKCISIYFSQKIKGNNVIYLNITNDYTAEKYVRILKSLRNYKFLYINRIEQVSYEKIKEILRYAKNMITFPYYYCDDYWMNHLSNLKDIDFITYIKLTSLNVDIILNYSRKYQNRIQSLDVQCWDCFEKVNEIVKLNSQSLTYSAIYNNYYLTLCENLTGVKIEFLEKELTLSCIFPNIIRVDAFCRINISSLSPSEKQRLLKVNLSYFNAFPNLTHFNFISERMDSDFWLLFLLGLKTKKLRTIEFTGIIDDYALDFDPIIQHFPELESIKFCDFNRSSDYVEEIYHGHCTNIDYPNLKRLIHNYLNTHPNNNITFHIFSASSPMLDYFQYKTNLHNRIQTIEVSSNKWFNIKYNYKKCLSCFLERKFDIMFFRNFENIDFVVISEVIFFTDDELIEFLLKIKPYVIFYGNCEIVNTLKQYMTYQTNIKIIYGYRSKHLLYADKILEDMNDSIL